MSLVAYESSDSDEESGESTEELEERENADTSPSVRSDKLKSNEVVKSEEQNGLESADIGESELDYQKPSLFSSLPPPKARVSNLGGIELEESKILSMKDEGPLDKKQTVKIIVPSMTEFKDDDTLHPPTKKLKPSLKGSGLFSLLPAPKHLSVKETKRSLVPHVLTKKPPSSAAPKQTKKLSELISYADSGDESEGEETEKNSAKKQDFFSLNEDKGIPHYKQYNFVLNPSPDVTYKIIQEQNNEPNSSQVSSTKEHPVVDGKSSPVIETSITTDFIPLDKKDFSLNGESLQRLCGRKAKRNQELEFIEVNGDSIMPDPNEWLTKQLTEEQVVKVHSHSHRKTDGPTTQQRRKHQITYLAFQAKENELELKNQWSQNRVSHAERHNEAVKIINSVQNPWRPT